MTDQLRDIYETLKGVGLCATQAEFSQEWLGRSAHYMAQIDGDARRASLTSLRLLASELMMVTLIAKNSADNATYRRIRSAWVAAQTLCDGVFELRHVPPCHRITAMNFQVNNAPEGRV